VRTVNVNCFADFKRVFQFNDTDADFTEIMRNYADFFFLHTHLLNEHIIFSSLLAQKK
jgi:hypothetical protein